jgi:hypothetical protein
MPIAVASAPPASAPSGLTPWVTVDSDEFTRPCRARGTAESTKALVVTSNSMIATPIAASLPIRTARASQRGPDAAGNANIPTENTDVASRKVRPRPMRAATWGASSAPTRAPIPPATVTPATMSGVKSRSRVR